MKKINLSKKTLRTLAYTGIVGGCALLALIFFSISQYEKAKYEASVIVKLSAKASIDRIDKDFTSRVKRVIVSTKNGEDLNSILNPLGLKNEDFAKLSDESSDDVENSLIKLQSPIYAIEGDDEEHYNTRYALAAPIFGDHLADKLARRNSEANWWIIVLKDFIAETAKNSAAYVGTAIPAYTFSMATLVAFGLVLKHAEKTREKEEKEV
jgi:hypothetical protein